MKFKHRFILPFAFVPIMAFAVAADIFEYKIPPGWTFREAVFSDSGLKAIVIWQDVPREVARYGIFQSRLLIFNKENQLVNELGFGKPKFPRLTRDDKIILMEADENEDVNKITVFNSLGGQLFETGTKGRWPFPALLGKEIGLAEPRVGTPLEFIGPISIIDGETGKERITVEPPSDRGFSGFLPIGEGGQFLIALGATVYLRTYLHPEQDLWKINNIGGYVTSIRPVDEKHIGFQYHIVNIEANKFLAGVAIIEWRSGKIIFRQESYDNKAGLWKILHTGVNIALEEGDLVFTNLGSKSGIRIAKSDRLPEKWDNAKLKKYKIDNWGERDQTTPDSKYLIKREKGLIRIERIRYIEEN